ncbi:hypothetical protein HHK36_030290 [Tetracentron sinense]|uniref:DDT domain-containing protein n=1 Tax=Tetracentron sinense TaxID=13715 RepID=A0A834Y9M7_TETSI|nr:hypothetical protein HHK36_030290 [Tetracentron sinense]
MGIGSVGKLRLRDLVNTIIAKLQEHLSVGVELYGRKDKCFCPCKILKVLDKDIGKTLYEVGWLDKDKKVMGSSVITGDELIRKKLPFSRDVLKSFIRDSTFRSAPWIIHDKLARKHGVLTELPEELRHKIIQSGCHVSSKQRMKNKEDGENIRDAITGGNAKIKRERQEIGKLAMRKKVKEEDQKPKEGPIKYPIDDLLVQLGADDPVFTDHPSLSRDFSVPMECVGDLLMVWDFFSSFSRLLNLWPFSLEDFENAICHKDSNLILIVESHSALLRFLLKDESEYFMAIQEKGRKLKITLTTWAEYLCDFLGMDDIPKLSSQIATIKRGHYGLLDACDKLSIFRELVARALATDAIRVQLDEYIEQQQALAATKKEVALEESRKRREEKEIRKSDYDTKEVMQGHILENGGSNLHVVENGNDSRQNGDALGERHEKVIPCKGGHVLENSEGKHVNNALRKIAKKLKIDVKVAAENVKEPSGVEEHRKKLQLCKNNKKGCREKKSEEQRKEHLEREIEKRFVRTNPLGKDRNYNRYWFFRRDGRIFVESSDSKLWGYYSSKEELDVLMSSLNRKGEREMALQRQLEKYYHRICSALQRRSKGSVHKIALEEAAIRRSTRVRAPPRENPALAFLRYGNKWKE